MAAGAAAPARRRKAEILAFLLASVVDCACGALSIALLAGYGRVDAVGLLAASVFGVVLLLAAMRRALSLKLLMCFQLLLMAQAGVMLLSWTGGGSIAGALDAGGVVGGDGLGAVGGGGGGTGSVGLGMMDLLKQVQQRRAGQSEIGKAPAPGTGTTMMANQGVAAGGSRSLGESDMLSGEGEGSSSGSSAGEEGNHEMAMRRLLGLPKGLHPDLRIWDPEEIRSYFPRVFDELPEQFDAKYKNPCWGTEVESGNAGRSGSMRGFRKKVGHLSLSNKQGGSFQCLPYVYLLGMPKCGSSDLWERLVRHDEVSPPDRKEIRWFTRGEFVTEDLDEHHALGAQSSLVGFTKHFHNTHVDIHRQPDKVITVDGGPHTLWWPTQTAGGHVSNDVPTPQLLKQMQPDAKFLVTLRNPTERMYSDYNFIGDDLRPVHEQTARTKTPENFHKIAVQHVQDMQNCIQEHTTSMEHELPTRRLRADKPGTKSSSSLGAWKNKLFSYGAGAETAQHEDFVTEGGIRFRAAQECAHDRKQFGYGPTGRIGVGMYAVFLEKWFEHFDPSQFLVLRMEDYERDPKAHMQRVVDFLGLDTPGDWGHILEDRVFNEHRWQRQDMLPETRELLDRFYRPFNMVLAKLLNDTRFQDWAVLKEAEQLQLPKQQKQQQPPPPPPPPPQEPPKRDGEFSKRHWGVARFEDRRTGDAAELSATREMMEQREQQQQQQQQQQKLKEQQPQPPADPADGTEGVTEGMRAETHKGGFGGEDVQSFRFGDAVRHHEEEKAEAAAAEKQADNVASEHRFGQEGTSETHPRALDISQLPKPTRDIQPPMRKFLDSANGQASDPSSMALGVCTAAMSLDVAGLKELLWGRGVHGDVRNMHDSARNGLHCLSAFWLLTDSLSKSHVFTVLRDERDWLDGLMDSPTELGMQEVGALDLLPRLRTPIVSAARWLIAAGADVNARDTVGFTPLHFAARGGMDDLVKVLLEAGADVTAQENKLEWTPLHMAALGGHGQSARDIVDAGGNRTVTDAFGLSFNNRIQEPGTFTPTDAKTFFNVDQRRPRSIPAPEVSIPPAGDGGWSTERLDDYMAPRCDLDQYYAHEISSDQIFDDYIAMNRPVLIRGLLSNKELPAYKAYSRAGLEETWGNTVVEVSDIPYSAKFGSDHSTRQPLREYLEHMNTKDDVGGEKYPWYVFKGFPIPGKSEEAGSMVPQRIVAVPPLVREAVDNVHVVSGVNRNGDGPFVNSQWALGGRGTGAPVHYHNTAVSQLFYGLKRWVLYPPHYSLMGRQQVREWMDNELDGLERRGYQRLTCMQYAGDVMIIPEGWGHGVLNVQQSVAVASEVRSSLFRITPAPGALQFLPDHRLSHRERDKRKRAPNGELDVDVQKRRHHEELEKEEAESGSVLASMLSAKRTGSRLRRHLEES